MMANARKNVVPKMTFLSALVMWLCGSLFYIFQYGARSSFPNLLTKEYMQFFDINSAQVGLIASSLYIMYTAMQIPAGVLLDRFGAKKTATFACFLCSTGMAILTLTSNYYVACASQLLTGTGAAFAMLSLLKISNTWFEPRHVPIMASLSMAIGSLGAIILGYVIAKILEVCHWKDVLFWFFIIGYVITCIIWFVVKDECVEACDVGADDKDEKKSDSKIDNNKKIDKTADKKGSIQKNDCNCAPSIIENLKFVITSKQVWVLFFITFFWHAPLVAIADLWGTTFLKAVYPNIDNATALGINNMLYFGFTAGLMLLVSLAYKMQSYKKPMYLSVVVMIFAFIVILFCENLSLNTMRFLFATVGFCCGGMLTYQALLSFLPKSISGTASSFINTGGMLCGVLLQPLIGYLLKTFCAKYQDGIPVYVLEDFQKSFGIILVFMIVIVFLMPFMKETFPKDDSGK